MFLAETASADAVKMSWAEDEDRAELLASTPFTSHIDFTADAAFDLFFTDYNPNPSGSNVSGFTFDLLDGVSGSAVQRFTNGAATGCVDDGDPPDAAAPVAGNCTFITALGNTGGNADLALTASSSPPFPGSRPAPIGTDSTTAKRRCRVRRSSGSPTPRSCPCRPRCRCSSPGLPASAS
nr:hypothetical protein [Pikeienuella piscinae]